MNECDTKLNVLNVLSYLIERVGVAIRPGNKLKKSNIREINRIKDGQEALSLA